MSAPAKPNILCVGLACIDIVTVCESFPLEDSDHRGVDQRWSKGGNASNSATAISLLPNTCTSHYFGTLSQSNETRFLEAEFEKSGVDISQCVYCENSACPTSIVIVNQQNGSRTILHANKNLRELSKADFSRVDLNVYSWIHIEGRPNEEAITWFLDHVSKFNDARQPNNRVRISIELEKTRLDFSKLMDKVDVLFVSKEYAQMLGYSCKDSAVRGLVQRCKKGAAVICPWAEDGAAAMTNASTQDIATSPAFPPVKLVDTLAAGDTFIAATLTAMTLGRDLQDSITYGCKIAGAKCGMHGLEGLRNCEPCDH